MTTTEKTYLSKDEWATIEAAERAYIKQRREHVGIVEGDPGWEDEGPIGLTFSGGGIRSATFNLGIIQGLSKLGVLPYIDYLSTVSGGGYIGACVTSLLADLDSFSTRHNNFPLNPNIKAFQSEDVTEPETFNNTTTAAGVNAQVAHLRRRGNFIAPQLQLFSIDVMRAVGASITGIFFTIGIFMIFFLALASTHYAFAGLLTSDLFQDGNTLAAELDATLTMAERQALLTELALDSISDAPDTYHIHLIREKTNFIPNVSFIGGLNAGIAQIISPDIFKFTQGIVTFAVGAIVAMLAVSVLYFISLEETLPRSELMKRALSGTRHKPMRNMISHLVTRYLDSQDAEEEIRFSSRKNRYERAALLLITIICIVVMAVTIGILKWVQPAASNSLYWLLTPFIFTVGVRVGTVILHPFFMNSRRWTFDFRSAQSMFQGYSTYAMVFFLIATILIVPQYVNIALPSSDVAIKSPALPAMTVIFSALWAAWLSRSRSDSSNSMFKQFFTLPQILRNALLGILVWLIMFTGIYFYEVLFEALVELVIHQAMPAIVSGIGLVAMLVFIVFGSIINYNRVSPHYFYRDRIAETFLMTETPNRRGEVETVRDDREIRMKDINQYGSTAPYHVVLGSLNLLGSRNLDRKDRKSDYFTFTKDYCGSDTTGYVRTDRYLIDMDKDLTDPANSGIKLSRAAAISGAAVGSGTGLYSFFAIAFITTLFNVRLGYWMLNPAYYDESKEKPNTRTARLLSRFFPYPLGEGRTFWPKYLLQELFGTTNEHSNLINLSDGAHTGDNTSLAPLLKRKCRVIIASDAGDDADYFFASIANVIRQVYIDDRIKINIDLNAIIPDETGYSEQHAAVGEILYPNENGAAPTKGWLIVIKPTLTGDEPAQLMTYYRQNRVSKFPHQSTGDQFFDDDQFEAYRTLGELSVTHTFKHSEFFQQQGKANERTIIVPQADGAKVDTSTLTEQTVVPDLDTEDARINFEYAGKTQHHGRTPLQPPSAFFSDDNLRKLANELKRSQV